MDCLDVIGIIISPSSSHAFGIARVWDDLVVVGELLVADGALPVLLDNLAIDELPHFGGKTELPVSSRMTWIFYAPNTGRPAEQGLVNRAGFAATESHRISLGWIKD